MRELREITENLGLTVLAACGRIVIGTFCLSCSSRVTGWAGISLKCGILYGGWILVAIIPFIFIICTLASLVVARCVFKNVDRITDWLTDPSRAIGTDNGFEEIEPFSVPEYFSRIEKAYLDILEDCKPVDQVITLWWRLDGLRLNEDGTTEWISRRKPKSEPISQNVFYQPERSIMQTQYPVYDVSGMCQSTQATIDALQAQKVSLSIQAAQSAQNMAIMQALCPPYPYFSQGLNNIGTYSLTRCFCEGTRDSRA